MSTTENEARRAQDFCDMAEEMAERWNSSPDADEGTFAVICTTIRAAAFLKARAAK